MVAIVVLSSFFFVLCSASAFYPLTKLQSKQCSVNMGWNKGKHGLLWRVCWLSDRVWWTFLILSLWCYFFFVPGEMFWEAQTPTQGSPVEPWQLNKWLPLLLLLTFDPRALSCPAERGLLKKPSWFNNIFSPRAAKALNCLTPVASSVELQHNCSYLPYILAQSSVVCHACFLDTWMQPLFISVYRMDVVKWQELHEWYASWNLLKAFMRKLWFMETACGSSPIV